MVKHGYLRMRAWHVVIVLREKYLDHSRGGYIVLDHGFNASPEIRGCLDWDIPKSDYERGWNRIKRVEEESDLGGAPAELGGEEVYL